MDTDYDTFSYDVESNDQFYEAVLDSNFPPIPPRKGLPPVPTRKQPPLPTTQQTPSFTKLPPRVPYLPDTPTRLPPPVPDASNRLPPPVPDASQRLPPPVPDVPQVEEMNYEDLNDYDDHPQLDYEDLNCEELPKVPATLPRALPSVPDKSQRRTSWVSQFDFEKESKRNILDVSVSQVDDNILISTLKNLKKTDSRPPVNNPKPQAPVQPEIRSQTQLSSVKPPLYKKPELPKKPFTPNLANVKTSTVLEKITSLNLDSTDAIKPKPIQTKLSQSNSFTTKSFPKPIQTKLSQSNSFTTKSFPKITPTKLPPRDSLTPKSSAIITPTKLPPRDSLTPQSSPKPTQKNLSLSNSFTSVASEDISDESCSSGEEYADAADIKSLHYQPYYYEILTKPVENKIFHKDTENGTFVIRKSKTKSNHPYTMLVFYETRTYRLKIRFEDDNYAIGEKKADEKKFPSVIKLVEHFMVKPLLLIDAGSVKLKLPPEDI